MIEDLNKLRELAESLQAGSAGFVRTRDFLNARHDFIAAFNPATALSLLSRLQAAEERAEKLEGALAVVRMSRGWQYMSDETKALIEAAVTRAALKTEGA